MDVFGTTRSKVRDNYALITPDSHVVCTLVDWEKASAIIHISPELGARFMQYTAILAAGARGAMPEADTERLVYVLDGEIKVDGATLPASTLGKGGFGYFPAGAEHAITAAKSARLMVIEKVYQPLAGAATPRAVVGNEADIRGEPFMGDPDAVLKTLLPVEPAFDMAVNIFTYNPGATLPQVEMHVMEHGLLMLEGAGVYRLGDDYHPVAAGDVIWMASYCPQWFVAMGKRPARYIYYKDVHRDALGAKL